MNTVLEDVQADDFVEYFVYPSAGKSCTTEELTELHSKLSSFVLQWADQYFWHRDKFTLSTVSDVQSSGLDCPCLQGVIHFGENIDDEWFVVYLLKKISENFDVVTRVVDSDGEFLLIEAANHLSKWMNPDDCDRRVYLHKGVIRIIPIDTIPKIVSFDPIVAYLNNSHELTETEKKITACIDGRIEKYSENLEDLLHRSRAYLPAKVAALLDAKPDLISAAVAAYFHQNVIDKKICRKMEHFPPDDLVLRLVTFTKFSFAMICHDKNNPERNRWVVPPPSHPQYKEHLLGYKITRGFEILASNCTKKTENNLELSEKWNQYLQALNRRGYFKGLIERSKGYVELEKKARMYFLDNVGVEECSNNNILSILQTLKYNVEEMKREESTLAPSEDEKWMEVTEDQFNKLLEDRFGLKGMDVTNTPNALSSAINKFLNQVSDVEGIEIKNDEISSHKNEMDVDEETNSNIFFEPDNFKASILQIMRELQDEKDKNGTSNENSEDYDSASESDDDAPEDPDMKSYMDLMDKEVESATLSRSSANKCDEVLDSVNIDVDAVANILKSYEEQFGGSGPAGNLLHSLGLKVDTKKTT